MPQWCGSRHLQRCTQAALGAQGCPKKAIAQQEKEKKGKYLNTCHELRKDFTPLVNSVDGMAGREAMNAEQRLAYHLAAKWARPQSQLVNYVHVHIALSIARANTLLLQGSRDR